MTIARRNHGRSHSYRLDGEKVPGVTTIIGETINKGALIEWAGNTTADYALDHWQDLAFMHPSQRHKLLKRARYFDRDTAANKGTRVHRLAERLVAGDEVPVPDELAGHVESYTDFLNRCDPHPVGVELVIANRAEWYCGTIDLIADLPCEITCGDQVYAPGRWLLDIKTGRSGIFREAVLQQCAYLHAEVFADGDDERPFEWLQVHRAAAIHVRADGWDFRPLDTGPVTWAYFQHLRWLHDHDEDSREWIGDAAEPPQLPQPTPSAVEETSA